MAGHDGKLGQVLPLKSILSSSNQGDVATPVGKAQTAAKSGESQICLPPFALPRQGTGATKWGEA